MRRRNFIKNGLALAGALSLNHDLIARRERRAESQFKHFVFINLLGAPSHLEMFDPKPQHKNGGPTKTVNTRTPGLIFAEDFGRLAELSDKMAVMRMTSTDRNHGTAQEYLQYGAIRTLGAASNRPTMGAIAAHSLSKGQDSGLPVYVNMGGDRGPGGFLGNNFSSFSVNPSSAGKDFTVETEIKQKIAKADAIRRKLRELSPYSQSSTYQEEIKNQKSSLYVIEHGERIFDIKNESQATKDKFTGTYGESFLLTKRLIAHGVNSLQINIGGWDTHSNNFETCKNKVSALDIAIDALVKELIEMEKFDKTLIMICGEFGRTPKINNDDGRDHFSNVFNAAFISGGIRGGQVFGESSKDGTKIKNGITREQLCHSAMSLLGTPTRFEEINKAPERLLPVGFGIPDFN